MTRLLIAIAIAMGTVLVRGAVASAQVRPTITFKAGFLKTGSNADVTLDRPVGWSLVCEAVGAGGTSAAALSESNLEVTVELPAGSYCFTVPGQSFNVPGWVLQGISPSAFVVLDPGDNLDFTLDLVVGTAGGDISVLLAFYPKPTTDWQVTVSANGASPMSATILFSASVGGRTGVVKGSNLQPGDDTISTSNESANLSAYAKSISPATTTVTSGVTANVDIDYSASGQPIPTVTA